MAVTTTGSRNGIIAWAVTATILGVGSLIWATISYTQASKAERDLQALTGRYNKIASAADLAGEDVTALEAAKGDESRGLGQYNLLPLSRQQTIQLSQFLAGASVSDDKAARAQVQGVLDRAKAGVNGGGNGGGSTTAPTEGGVAVEAPLDTSSVVSALRGMTDNAQKLRDALKQREAELAAARAAVAQAEKDKQQIIAEQSQSVEAVVQSAREAQQNAQTYSTSQDEQVANAQKLAAEKTEEGIKNADELNNQLIAANQKYAQLQRDYNETKAQLEKFRVPVDQILQKADGVITRVTGTDRVAINLGRGDGIAPGMTFEVYDRLGVPRPKTDNAAEDAALKGKASIEVVSVQPGISECRIVRQTPGLAITEGDPISNLVYDKNVKFNFYVYGNFNLDYKGPPTERDTEIVRRLISGWGGNVAQDLNSKTDFVILGDEPVVPNYTQEELTREPQKAFEKERAEQALEAWTETRTKANQLNIPILNQTRFLYMVGYYEEAGR